MRHVIHQCLPAALLGALLLAAGCDRKGEAGGPPGGFAGRPPAMVIAADVVARSIPVYLDEIGHCVAREVVNVQPQVAGKVMAIHFKDGADLKKGDKLFTIDPRPFEAQLAGAKALYAKDRALAINARASATRQQKLFEQKLLSPSDFDQARYTAEAQEATVQNDEAAVQTAQLNLEYCNIVSPIDGRAGERQVDAGNVVRTDSATPLLTIQRLDPIYVDFTVTETDLPAVRQHMNEGTLKAVVRLPRDATGQPATRPASLALPAAAPAASDDLQPFLAQREGDLTFMDNAVVMGTGTVKLRATVPNQDRLFWPGQFVRVRLILDTMKNVPMVPGDALQLSQQGTFVYVIKSDSTVEPRPVKVGQRHGDMVAIESGLAPNEKVVVTGQLTLSPGAKVIVSNPPAAAPAPGGHPSADAGGSANGPVRDPLSPEAAAREATSGGNQS